MSDQASLPVTFPAGTEFTVKGKVEVSGKVEVTNTVKTEVTNVPKVEVANEPKVIVSGKVEVTNTVKTEVTNTPKVEVSNIPAVTVNSGKIEVTNTVKTEVTNTVKVEGITAGSKLKIENGAGETEASVNKKRVLTTAGEQQEFIELEKSTNEEKILLPETANSLCRLVAITVNYAQSVALAEKTIVSFSLEISLTAIKPMFFDFILGPELLGAGTKELQAKVSFGVGCQNSITNYVVAGQANLKITRAIPQLYFGLGKTMQVKILGFTTTVANEPTKESKVTAGVGNLFYMTKEGTL